MALYSSTLATLRGTLGGWNALYEVSLRLEGTTAVTFEEQSTVPTQVEVCLTSRPLNILVH
jgi:hypothetical protein